MKPILKSTALKFGALMIWTIGFVVYEAIYEAMEDGGNNGLMMMRILGILGSVVFAAIVVSVEILIERGYFKQDWKSIVKAQVGSIFLLAAIILAIPILTGIFGILALMFVYLIAG